jgi:endoglucanase
MKILSPASMKATLLLFFSLTAFAASPVIAIKVDQAGYPSSAPKLAMVVSSGAAPRFQIRRTSDGSAVFKGDLSASVMDANSGDSIQRADFSVFTKPGEYYIDVDGLGRSWNFRVGPDVYSRPYSLAMRAFYGQRCGTAVDLGSEFPGYKHDACHLDGAYHASSGKTGPHVSSGGWHDAGDYGRYMVNSGISTGTLLWAWELFGKQVNAIPLHLPESGNGVPDILNEVRWNLNWMLTLQDEDGGVWHKQTSTHFCAFIMPEQDTLTSYVIGTGSEPYKSSCATAGFAAVMAIAARDFKPFDAPYAAKCLQAARKAWHWLERYPNVTFENPSGITTGAYGDRHCDDERFWAAAELWRTTHDGLFADYFTEHYQKYLSTITGSSPQSWSDVGALGLWTYVLGNGGNLAAITDIKQQTIMAAAKIAKRSDQDGYRISLTASDYNWGSNGTLANYAMQLLIANTIAPHTEYVNAALEDVHYLLGRNTFSLSFVTRVGEHAFQHPHHRPSIADKNAEPWPGLLSGGPNRSKQDPAMKALPDGLSPAKMYLDDEQSYATNEVAINWNAPLVFVLAGLLSQN